MSFSPINLASEPSFLDGVVQSETTLGEGGFGIVFSGSWHGREVAIKRFHAHRMGFNKHTGKQSQAFQRFVAEYDTLRRMSHPSIVQAFGWLPPDTDRGSPGLVMEYLPVTLKERYNEEPHMTVRQHVLVMMSTASGLDYLHGRGVIHRDLTTSNIMMTAIAGSGPEEGHCKITDVGLATLLADSKEVQTMTATPGVERYMAPETMYETAEGRARYGRKADIFSLGVAVMAMIIRREPPTVLILIKKGRGPDVENIPHDHPLRSLVVQCIDDTPGERPSATYLCSELPKVYQLFTTPPSPAVVLAILRKEHGAVVKHNTAQQQQLDEAIKERDFYRLKMGDVVQERDKFHGQYTEAVSRLKQVTEEWNDTVTKAAQVTEERDALKSQLPQQTPQERDWADAEVPLMKSSSPPETTMMKQLMVHRLDRTGQPAQPQHQYVNRYRYHQQSQQPQQQLEQQPQQQQQQPQQRQPQQQQPQRLAQYQQPQQQREQQPQPQLAQYHQQQQKYVQVQPLSIFQPSQAKIPELVRPLQLLEYARRLKEQEQQLAKPEQQQVEQPHRHPTLWTITSEPHRHIQQLEHDRPDEQEHHQKQHGQHEWLRQEQPSLLQQQPSSLQQQPSSLQQKPSSLQQQQKYVQVQPVSIFQPSQAKIPELVRPLQSLEYARRLKEQEQQLAKPEQWQVEQQQPHRHPTLWTIKSEPHRHIQQLEHDRPDEQEHHQKQHGQQLLRQEHPSLLQ